MLKQLLSKRWIQIMIIIIVFFVIYKNTKRNNSIENFNDYYHEDKKCFRKSCSICRVGPTELGAVDFKPCCYQVPIDCQNGSLLQ